MSAAAELLLTTVDEYRRLPARDDVIQELHWGRVVTLTRPKMKHSKVQYRLVELLRPLVAGHGIVGAEIPFRALPEYDRSIVSSQHQRENARESCPRSFNRL
jgi:Uma2 family endonuclease